MTTPSGPEEGRPDPGLDAVMGEQRQLTNVAYRLRGSLADAEDAVQETYARWLHPVRAAAAGHRVPERVFRYPFGDVAEITGRSPAACRQLASSARRRIRAQQAPPAPATRRAGLVRDFKNAWEARDVAALVGLLDPAATMTADGGGLAPAALRPIEGGEQIARYAADLVSRPPGLTLLERTVNGQPGLVAQQDGVTVTVFAFDIAGNRITSVWAIRNPDKLRAWTTG